MSVYGDFALEFKNVDEANAFEQEYNKRRLELCKNPTENNYGSILDAPTARRTQDTYGEYWLIENFNLNASAPEVQALYDTLQTNKYNVHTITLVNEGNYEQTEIDYGPDPIDDPQIWVTREIVIPDTPKKIGGENELCQTS